jgi:hypothetical protein
MHPLSIMARLHTKNCPKCNEALHRIYTRLGRWDGKRIQYHQHPIGFVCYHCADNDDNRNKLPSIHHYLPVSAAIRNNPDKGLETQKAREAALGILPITKEEVAAILKDPTRGVQKS